MTDNWAGFKDGETVRVGHGPSKVDATTLVRLGRIFVLIAGVVYDLCGRCGTEFGTISGYLHRLGGICIACHGAGAGRRIGTVEDAEKVAARRVAEKARRDARRAAAHAQRLAAQTAWREANAELFAALEREHHLHTTHDGEAQRRDEKLTRRPWALIELAAAACRDRAETPLTDDEATEARTLLAEVAAADAADRAARAAKVTASRYAADPGQRVTVTGTVMVAKPYETAYGGGVFLVVEGTGDDAGVTLVWSGSASGMWALRRGDATTITATVKELGEREGVKQTKVTRGRVDSHTPAEEPAAANR
ncbi:MAG: hypothetical protein EPO06_11830 [Burkholderiaceae bacterium]|nr:MAG: hypothetical protein EPO06_11830 [Burkholderiaceae bacterium]